VRKIELVLLGWYLGWIARMLLRLMGLLFGTRAACQIGRCPPPQTHSDRA